MLRRISICIATVLLSASAVADVQNVSVGGELRIRARYWTNIYNDNGLETRIPGFFLQLRPIGSSGTASPYAYNDESNNRYWIEQNTRLKFSADFTHYVNAVIELDDFEVWGGDFRSNYMTGVDSTATSGDDVEILQSYIETNETGGLPLRLRIGRQQLKLGSGWLVGETQASIPISFDGVRATYTGDGYTIDGWATKLAEAGSAEQDGDIDFYGLSASCTAVEGQEFLVYWLYLRDAGSLNDTNFAAPIEWLENAFNLDDYDPTNLHTVGFRAAGSLGAFDYAGEIAYQFGNADSIGARFAPVNMLYGDDNARFNNWAGDLEFGYSFDTVRWAPRVYVGGAYFGGEDNRGLSFREWVNPFDKPDASVSFNRLFSSIRYTELFDEARNGTNFYQVRTGVDVKPTEALSASLEVAKFGVNESFDYPLMVTAGNWRIPVAPALPFLTQESGGDIGIVAGLELAYQYSDILTFRLVWSHLFASDDVNDGNFVFQNGLQFVGGSASDDADYFEFESRLKF